VFSAKSQVFIAPAHTACLYCLSGAARVKPIATVDNNT